jgi:hypothetical protein
MDVLVRKPSTEIGHHPNLVSPRLLAVAYGSKPSSEALQMRPEGTLPKRREFRIERLGHE